MINISKRDLTVLHKFINRFRTAIGATEIPYDKAVLSNEYVIKLFVTRDAISYYSLLIYSKILFSGNVSGDNSSNAHSIAHGEVEAGTNDDNNKITEADYSNLFKIGVNYLGAPFLEENTVVLLPKDISGYIDTTDHHEQDDQVGHDNQDGQNGRSHKTVNNLRDVLYDKKRTTTYKYRKDEIFHSYFPVNQPGEINMEWLNVKDLIKYPERLLFSSEDNNSNNDTNDDVYAKSKYLFHVINETCDKQKVSPAFSANMYQWLKLLTCGDGYRLDIHELLTSFCYQDAESSLNRAIPTDETTYIFIGLDDHLNVNVGAGTVAGDLQNIVVETIRNIISSTGIDTGIDTRTDTSTESRPKIKSKSKLKIKLRHVNTRRIMVDIENDNSKNKIDVNGDSKTPPAAVINIRDNRSVDSLVFGKKSEIMELSQSYINVNLNLQKEKVKEKYSKSKVPEHYTTFSLMNLAAR